jgi:glycosyltransferase involved in cell wall biosynthesis
MKVVHVSYAVVPQHDDPHQWLRAINFFTGIVTCMAQTHDVSSVHCINYNGVVMHEGVAYHFLKTGRWRWLSVLKVNRYVQKLQPDIVIIHGLHFSWQLLCLRFLLGDNVRLFAQHHAERPVRYHKRFLQRWADRFIKGYFFSSAGLGKMWTDAALIKDPAKIHEVMEVSSAFRLTDPAEAKARCGVQGNPVYLWVGRLDANKDPETVLKAFTAFAAHHPSATLYLIFRNNTLLKTVRALTSQMPDRIKLVGKVAHSEMEQWYNASDFIVSTSHYEGSGVAVCEAMSCGCIPVLSDIPAFRMMTDGGTGCGILFPRGDVAALTHALKKSVMLDRCVEKNKVLHQFATRLSFEAIAERINRVISSAG